MKNEFVKQNDHTSVKNTAAVTAFLTIILLSPVGDGRLLSFVTMLAFFATFLTYAFFSTRKYHFSLWKELHKYHVVTFWLLLGFCLSSLVSYLLVVIDPEIRVPDKIRASVWYVLYMVFFAYAFMLARFCIVSGLSHRRIFLWLNAGMLALIAMLLGFYHLAGAPNAAGWSTNPPVGVHVRIMGMVASIAIVSNVVFLVLENTLSRRFALFLYASIFVGGAFMVWSGSRMSIVVVVITVLLLLTLARQFLQMPWRKAAMIVLVLLLAAPASEPFSIFPWSGMGRMLNVSSLQSATQGQEEAELFEVADKVSSSRMQIWKNAVMQIRQSPLFGAGPYGFFRVEKSSFGHPHNIILQFLVEWGFVGASLLFGFLLCLAVNGIKKIRPAFEKRDSAYVAAAAVVFMLSINAAVDGTYFALFPLFYLVTAYAVFPFLPGDDMQRFRESICGGRSQG